MLVGRASSSSAAGEELQGGLPLLLLLLLVAVDEQLPLSTPLLPAAVAAFVEREHAEWPEPARLPLLLASPLLLLCCTFCRPSCCCHYSSGKPTACWAALRRTESRSSIASPDAPASSEACHFP